MNTENELPARQGHGHRNDVENFFSRNTEFWDSIYGAPPGPGKHLFSSIMTRRKKAVLKTVDVYSGGSALMVLDTGCGPGVIMEELLERGHRVIAMDISHQMLREAHRKASRRDTGSSLCLQGDIETLPLGNDCVDMVLCLGVLPYLKEDRNGISEMRRVLRTGGIVIVVIPNLLRVTTLLDPYYYLCRAWQYFWYRVRGNATMKTSGQSADDFGQNRTFGIRRYHYGELESLFRVYGFNRTCLDGVEYGPLTFWKREFLPDSVSLRINDTLERLSDIQCLRWIKVLAGQWILCFEKTRDPKDPCVPTTSA